MEPDGRLEWDASVTHIPAYRFRYCGQLTAITIPGGVTSIGYMAFASTGLERVVLRSGVQRIESQAFRDCGSISLLSLPASVTSIDSSAFANVHSLSCYILSDGVAGWDDADGLPGSTAMACSSMLLPPPPPPMSPGAEVHAEALSCDFDANNCEWRATGSRAWLRKSGGTSSYSTGPTTGHGGGGWYLYTEASGIYNTLYRLESPSFTLRGAAALGFWYHMYGSSMGTLSVRVFDGEGWSEVWSKSGNQGNAWRNASTILPDSATRIRFDGRTGTSFASDMAIDDVWISSLQPPQPPLPSLPPLPPPPPALVGTSCADVGAGGALVWDADETEIPDGAFDGCSTLRSITIPDTVTRVGDSAFRGCWGLTSVALPNSVTSIGSAAFENCYALAELALNVPPPSPPPLPSPPPSPPPPPMPPAQPTDVNKDPHLRFAHGGRADFRGRNRRIYNFFSAPGLSLNLKTEEAGDEERRRGTTAASATHRTPAIYRTLPSR